MSALFAGPPAFSQPATVTPDGKWPKASFPLRVEPGKRYLVDARGRPFFMHGDTAWSLIAQLSREDADRYLADREARGFNTILVNLIEHKFAAKPPANVYGAKPFELEGSWPFTMADFSRPTEAYFAHADWVLKRAEERGFLVLLAPAYLGFRGGDEGWYKAIIANGSDRLRQYGEYLGRRYANFTNILWTHAGDYDPPQKDVVHAIADGIRKFAGDGLHTAHCAPETAAIEYWKDAPWLNVNNVYTYGPVYAASLRQYLRPEKMPFFLMESRYEFETDTGHQQRMRAQAYYALLTGAFGHVFGNNPIWHFDGPPIYPPPMKWREALSSPGSRSMAPLRSFFESIPWWTLEPEPSSGLLTGGRGAQFERAVAARTADASLVIVYIPTNREISVDLARLRGPVISAAWIDPSDGREVSASDVPSQKGRAHAFETPGKNASGYEDWLLVLRSK